MAAMICALLCGDFAKSMIFHSESDEFALNTVFRRKRC
jgi:hypothetical protein